MPKTPQQANAWLVVMTNQKCDEKAEAAIEVGFTGYRPACRKEVRLSADMLIAGAKH